MKPSKDKIEKLRIMFPVNVTEEEIPRYFAVFESKINEVIDKLESQPEEHKQMPVGKLWEETARIVKDPSPKKECEHDETYYAGSSLALYCKRCNKKIRRIYTSEGDAVGEVGTTWFPRKDETVYSINTQASNVDEIVYASTWGGRDWQLISMSLGLMFKTQEEANAKLKAMLGEVGGKE